MVYGMHKSHTLRRVTIKAPGGAIKTHYRTRKPSPATCQDTGVKLHGMARATPRKLSKLSKTQRRPQRPFGGVLSSKAARTRNVAHARSLN